ncbi:hypothetical protein BsWGS_06275 [Bradybaena similaris]
MAWLGRFDDFNSVGTGSDVSNKVKIQPSKSVSRVSRASFQTSSPAANRLSSESSLLHGQPGYCKIRDITSKMQTVAIIGVVISREAPKSVISRRGNASERHLLALTVCDAPQCFVNVTCWGSSEFVHFLSSEINVGDVVDIKGAHVQAKSNNSLDEKFKPWTPCACHLSLSDNQGSLAPYAGVDASQYLSLLHAPTRANNDFYTLEDIEANGTALQGEHINVLVAVKKIWPVREITTKSGKKTTKVDVVVCDETCPSFHLTLWDNFVQLVQSWTPLETVIFAADVKITFNEFRSSMVASTSSKTLVTVDPDTPEADSLRQFALHHGSLWSTEQDCVGHKDPDVETITTVLSVRGAKSLQQEVSDSGRPGYAVLFAFLSQLDVDADTTAVLKEVCCRCRRRVYESSGYRCTNSCCTSLNMSHDELADVEYSLTDHTGSLESCLLLPGLAEQMLGCKARDFQTLTAAEKTSIKWSYLLERARAVLKIKRADDRNGSKCFIHVLALEKADPQQLLDQGLMDS